MRQAIEQLANGDLVVPANGEGGAEKKLRRLTKRTREHRRWMRAVREGRLELRRAAGRFGGPTGPPAPSVEQVLGRLGVANADRSAQSAAVADAAYGGRLSLPQLREMRRAGFIPHDVQAP